MKNRILWLLLTVTMLFTLLAIPAAASGSEDSVVDGGIDVGTASAASNLWVGGTEVIAANMNDVLGDGTGSVKWDHETNTLTLTGATVNGMIKYTGTDALNLVLVDTETKKNTVSGGVDGDYGYGVWIDSSAALTISGTGSLEVTGGAKPNSYGIRANGNITVESGTVIATGGTAGETIQDGTESYGIRTNGTVTVSGTVTATGGKATGSYGIYANSTVTISGGEVTATGGTAGTTSCGIYANSTVTISGGEVTATGGTAGTNSYGICAGGSVTVNNDGIVKATGGELEQQVAGSTSYGIYANAINVTGGEVTACGGTATTSLGIYAGTLSLGTDTVSMIGGVGDTVDAAKANWAIGGTTNVTSGKAVYIAELYLYDLYVGGIRVTSANKADVLDDEKVSYDPVNNVLTLNGATVIGDTVSGKNTKPAIYYEESGKTLTIKLIGENKVYGAPVDSGTTAAIEIGNGAGVEITGSDTDSLLVCLAHATQTVSAYVTPDSENKTPCYHSSLGILMGVGSKLTISGGNITVKATDENGSAISVNATAAIMGDMADMVITGGTLTAVGVDSYDGYSSGIHVNSLTVSGGEVTATGGTAGTNSYGIYAVSAVTVGGGTVNATGGTATDSHGILVSVGYVTVDNGATVTATGGAATDGMSAGIYTDGAFSVGFSDATGATVYAYGGTVTKSETATDFDCTSAGIIARGGVSIEEGTVTATGGKAYMASYGILSNDYVDIGDNNPDTAGTTPTAKVTATGGEVTGNDGESVGIAAYGPGADSAHGGQITTYANAEVIATGGTAPNDADNDVYGVSFGIRANNNSTGTDSITLAGKVTATGGTAAYSYGIEAETNVELKELLIK